MIHVNYDRVKDRLNLDPFVMKVVDEFNVYLAGGALRGVFGKNEQIADYDLFFSSDRHIQSIEDTFLENEYRVVFRCPLGHLITLKNDSIKVQLIKERFYATPEVLINEFDINACRIAYRYGMIYTDRKAIRDMRRKRITLHNISHPNATFKRIMKYKEKGYSLPSETVDYFVNSIYQAGVASEPIDRRFYID